jgi:hypothetical protein
MFWCRDTFATSRGLTITAEMKAAPAAEMALSLILIDFDRTSSISIGPESFLLEPKILLNLSMMSISPAPLQRDVYSML